MAFKCYNFLRLDEGLSRKPFGLPKFIKCYFNFYLIIQVQFERSAIYFVKGFSTQTSYDECA